ncbi:histone-like nucleoid-structuring protein Lsr2 [Actinomadura sp. HBU206391]|uniref:histone-like nucleoid-structuring protein Lsr2 n=1 Tax=Actinomadura sp. HBU206391 TaxID=2731692 RepID=UPI00164F4F40|nr:Lsr2 family protein [Actinomadura sp. HBU206391]MBC6458930.1 Lsr2 family protein [Actinomadura sp. HBU206391]
MDNDNDLVAAVLLADETVSFAHDGVTYEIDLSADNANELRRSLAPYVEKARKPAARQAGRPRKATGRTAHSRERSADIRTWAKQHGITVNDRGPVSTQVVEAYKAGNPSQAKASKTVPRPIFQSTNNYAFFARGSVTAGDPCGGRKGSAPNQAPIPFPKSPLGHPTATTTSP